MDDDSQDYKVGYRQPPKEKRFVKGRSGNPKGRRQGRKNMATILHQVMHELINVKENGREKTMTKVEAITRQMVNKAVSGDLKAGKEMLHWDRVFQEAAERDPVTGPDRARDEEVLQNFFKRMQATTKTVGVAPAARSPEKDENTSDDEF